MNADLMLIAPILAICGAILIVLRRAGDTGAATVGLMLIVIAIALAIGSVFL